MIALLEICLTIVVCSLIALAVENAAVEEPKPINKSIKKPNKK